MKSVTTVEIEGLHRNYVRDIFTLQLFDDWRRFPLTNDPEILARPNVASSSEPAEEASDPDVPLLKSAIKPETLNDFLHGLYCNERRSATALNDSSAKFVPHERELSFHKELERLRGDKRDRRAKVLPVSGHAGCGKSTFLRFYFSSYRKEQLVANHADSRYLCLRVDLRDRASEVGLEEDAISSILPQVEYMLGRKRSEAESNVNFICRAIGEWRTEYRGNVFVWIDNVDTAVENIQLAAVKTLLDCFGGDRAVGRLVDIVIVAVRPETYIELEPQVLRRFEAAAFELYPLNIPEVLKRRIVQLQAICRNGPWTLTTEEAILWNHKHSETGRFTSTGGDHTLFPPLTQGSGPSQYTVFHHWARSDSEELFRLIETYAMGVSLSRDGIGGQGAANAREIYERLCGRSIARSLQLCENVINSKGVLIALKRGEMKLGSYTFLDALVSREIEKITPMNITNLFSLNRVEGSSGHQFILPYGLELLKADYEDEDPEDVVVPRRILLEKLMGIGFDKELCDLALTRFINARFLRRVAGADECFLRSRNTWTAHLLLLREIAYIDNVAQKSSVLKNVTFSNGYDVGNMQRRYDNTAAFIEKLWTSEREWLLSRSETCIARLRESSLQSVSVSCALALRARTEGLVNSGFIGNPLCIALQRIQQKVEGVFSGIINFSTLNEPAVGSLSVDVARISCIYERLMNSKRKAQL